MNEPPLIVILGQTASGKSALALELAKMFNGEIICADSRTIYREMDIGTAKPNMTEQSQVPHHVLNVVEPSESFSAAAFKRHAQAAIADISSRSKTAILVGGTGLYIDAVLFDLPFRAASNATLRASLAAKSVEELWHIIQEKGYDMPENSKNKRYLVRCIETGGKRQSYGKLRPNTLVLGVAADPETIKERIAKRVDAMLAEGFVEEYKTLLQKYSEDVPGFSAPGYKAFLPYMRGEILLDFAKQQFIKNDIHLAKRQRTWFRRAHYKNSIQWIINSSEAVALTTTFLNK